MLGDVKGKDVLDAGCGTGYLSRLLSKKGARVVGIDLSEKMIEVARRLAIPEYGGDFRVEDCSKIESVEKASMEYVVSIYCLQDLPDLEGAISSLRSVLRPDGTAVLIFGHPCFSGDSVPKIEKDKMGNKIRITYQWSQPYFNHLRIEEVWNGTVAGSHESVTYKTPFTFYHRPLSDYWKCFNKSGFRIVEFDEPVIRPPYPPGMTEDQIRGLRLCPWSVAFQLKSE